MMLPLLAGVALATPLAPPAVPGAPGTFRDTVHHITSRATGGGTDGTMAVEAAPFIALRQDGDQLFAAIPRRSLEHDFLVASGVVAVEPAEEADPMVGAYRRSGALRWRQAGDSLVLLQYTGAARSGPRYRRRIAVPVLRRDAGGAAVIDVTPLLAALEPEHMYAADSSSQPKRDLWTNNSEILTVRVNAFPARTEAMILRQEGSRRVHRRLIILRLPDTPMRPRLYDARLSYHDAGATLDTVDGRQTVVHYMTRWRLEKKDPTAAVSDVVRPITCRLSQDVPPQWVPYIKRGIEAWNPVFEAAGFRNAIVVIEPTPDTTSDPFAAADHAAATSANAAHEVTVYWQKQVANAFGHPELNDPRTGEILYNSIDFGGLLASEVGRLYFRQASASTSWIRLPYPDSILGKLIEMAATHEMGHDLGFDHNFKAGAAYPTDSLRSARFVHRMGHTASIMSYSYFNYVAQPEDHIPFEDLHAHIGPYDRWAVAWGYRPIPDAATPAAELPTLERWRAAQDTAPYLRAMVPEWQEITPDNQMYVTGSDETESAEYGVRNLARIAGQIEASGGADTVLLGGAPLAQRSNVEEQWAIEWAIAVDQIGGVTPKGPYAAVPFKTPVLAIDSARQVRALRAALAHLVYGGDSLLRQHVLPQRGGPAPALVLFDSLAPQWDTTQWRQIQQTTLARLLNGKRLGRVVAQAGSTHVLPTLCAELGKLRGALRVAAGDAHLSPAAHDQARALLAMFDSDAPAAPEMAPNGDLVPVVPFKAACHD